MERNFYARAVGAAEESYDRLKSWMNQLTQSGSDENNTDGRRAMSSADINPERLRKADYNKRDSGPHSAPNCGLHRTNSNSHFSNLMSYCRKAFGEMEYKSPSRDISSISSTVPMRKLHRQQFIKTDSFEEKRSVDMGDREQFSPDRFAKKPELAGLKRLYREQISMTCTEFSNDSDYESLCRFSTQFSRDSGQAFQMDRRMSLEEDAVCPKKVPVDEVPNNPYGMKSGTSTRTHLYSIEADNEDSNVEQSKRKASVISVTKLMTYNTMESTSESISNSLYSHRHTVYMPNVVKDSQEKYSRSLSDPVRQTEVVKVVTSDMDDVSDKKEKGTNERVTGRIRLCLQYFGSSKILRVILLRGGNLDVKKGHVVPKLYVHFGETQKKCRKIILQKTKAQSNISFNKETFFEDITEADMESLVLSIRLYNKTGIFGRSRCLGEMTIPVFKYDLSMNTNIRGTLRQKQRKSKAIKYFDEDFYDDIEILSDDRSISASVAASVDPIIGYQSRYCNEHNKIGNMIGSGAECLENIVEKEDFARNEQCLPFPRCFPKAKGG